MLLREFLSRAKQLTTALERWEEDGGPAAVDYKPERSMRPGPAVALLAIGRDARRLWLCGARVSRDTRIARLSHEITRRQCWFPEHEPRGRKTSA